MPKICTSCKQEVVSNYKKSSLHPDRVCCKSCIEKKNLKECVCCNEFFTRYEMQDDSKDRLYCTNTGNYCYENSH